MHENALIATVKPRTLSLLGFSFSFHLSICEIYLYNFDYFRCTQIIRSCKSTKDLRKWWFQTLCGAKTHSRRLAFGVAFTLACYRMCLCLRAACVTLPCKISEGGGLLEGDVRILMGMVAWSVSNVPTQDSSKDFKELIKKTWCTQELNGLIKLPSMDLTYPTWEKRKSSSKVPW